MKGICYLFGVLCSVIFVACMPNGAPPSACFYMTPRHLHPHTQRKVFPTRAMGLYNITTSADVFRPDRPIRVTLWGPPFKGFVMVAAEEGAKDWPTGIFYSEEGSSKQLSCLARSDTVTHLNNSYKDSVSALWYGPENMMSEQIQFIATVVVNLTIYYTDIKSGLLRLDPALAAPQAGAEGAVAAVAMDPWLSGSAAPAAPTNWLDPLGAVQATRGSSSGGGWGNGASSSSGGWGNGASSSSGGWGNGASSSSVGWGNGRSGSSGGWGAGTSSGGGWGSSGTSGTGGAWGGNSGGGSDSWQSTGTGSSSSSAGTGTRPAGVASGGSTGNNGWGASSDWQQVGTGSLISSHAATAGYGNGWDNVATTAGTAAVAGGTGSGSAVWNWDSPATPARKPVVPAESLTGGSAGPPAEVQPAPPAEGPAAPPPVASPAAGDASGSTGAANAWSATALLDLFRSIGFGRNVAAGTPPA